LQDVALWLFVTRDEADAWAGLRTGLSIFPCHEGDGGSAMPDPPSNPPPLLPLLGGRSSCVRLGAGRRRRCHVLVEEIAVRVHVWQEMPKRRADALAALA